MWSFFRERSRNNRSNLREWNNRTNLHETKIFSRKITKSQNEFSWVEWKIYIKHFQINETTWISENDRESAKMNKFFLWERWLNFIFTWRIVSLREWSWVNDNDNQSLIFLFWKSVNLSWWEMKILSTNQLSTFLFFESINSSIVDFLFRVFDNSSIDDFHDFLSQSTHQMIFTIFIFFSVETSFDKKRNKNHIHNNFTSNHQINKQSLKIQTKFSISRFVTLSTWSRNSRFVSFRLL